MKRLLHVINEVSLARLVAALTFVVLAFAAGYWWLSAHGSLVFTYDADKSLNFGDALYFSIVTISSLGYGDIRPVGWARLLVGLEVIVGLAYLGVLVAKISSVKQDYILRRMYTEAIDTKLEKYARELDEQRKLYRITSQLLISGEIDPELTMTFRRNSPGSTFFSLFRQMLSEVTALAVEEAGNGALFGHVDDSRLESLYDTVRGVLQRTMILWERNRDAACEYVLCDNAGEIDEICTLSSKLAKLGKKESRNADIIANCDAILGLCGQISTQVLPNI